MPVQADNPSPAAAADASKAHRLDVMVVDHWLIFDCPNCEQTIKLDRKDSVHPIECPACESGFDPLLDRDVKLPPRKSAQRRRRRRGPRGPVAEDLAQTVPEEPEVPVKKSRPTASSLPAEGVVKLALKPAPKADADGEEEGSALSSKLPVRSALELERRRVEALDAQSQKVQPDESELNAVIEEQSGGKYKRIRVRTRKKRLTEKQRMFNMVLVGGGISLVIVVISLWVAAQFFVEEDLDRNELTQGGREIVVSNSEPIGPVINNRNQLLSQVLEAQTVDVILKLIRQPKRLEAAIRAFYGEGTLPKLQVKDVRSSSDHKALLPKNFVRFQLVLDKGSVPVYVEKTESHGYRLDWESFVGYSTMPWEEFIANRATKTVRLRAHLSDANYYEGQYQESDFRCFRLEDPTRTHSLYVYYPRDDLKFLRLSEKIFEVEGSRSRLGKKGFEIPVLVDVRYRPGSSTQYQVDLVEYLSDSWLRP